MQSTLTCLQPACLTEWPYAETSERKEVYAFSGLVSSAPCKSDVIPSSMQLK